MEQSDSESKKYHRFKKWEYAVLFGLLAIALTAPYFFTQFNIGPSFAETGEIGDTIGGLTAPFINLVAAFLVYKSFSAQIQANIDQQKNHNDQIKLIRKEQSINALSYLFNEIENTIKKNEEPFGKNTVDFITRMRDELNIIKQNIGVPDYEKYVNRKQVQISKHIYEAIHMTSQNIKHLKVLTNHLEDYRTEFTKEKNTAELTYFFSTKINTLYREYNYREIAFGKLKDIIEVVKFENEHDVAVFYGLQNDIKELGEKIGSFSFASLFV